MNRLGIENISVFGLPPVEFVNLAADLGCRYISTGLEPIDYLHGNVARQVNPTNFGDAGSKFDAFAMRTQVAF